MSDNQKVWVLVGFGLFQATLISMNSHILKILFVIIWLYSDKNEYPFSVLFGFIGS